MKGQITTETNELGCLLVTSPKPDRYGYVIVKRNQIRYLLHRLVYEENYGEIPEGKLVRHSCDNPNCINPLHLSIGTHAQNVNDRVERDRSAKGEQHGRSKVSEQDVRDIRSSSETTNSLARKYGVDKKTIRLIRNYETWKHVT